MTSSDVRRRFAIANDKAAQYWFNQNQTVFTVKTSHFGPLNDSVFQSFYRKTLIRLRDAMLAGRLAANAAI